MELLEIKKIAEEIVDELKDHCRKIEIGGSIRRNKTYPNDIEIICIPNMVSPKRRKSSWCNAVLKIGRLIKGTDLNKNTYLQFRTPPEKGNIKVDLFIAPPNNWGMALLVRTGCSDFSHRIFGLMNKKGYSSKDFIHYDKQGNAKVFDTEEEIFEFLGIDYVEPEKRLR